MLDPATIDQEIIMSDFPIFGGYNKREDLKFDAEDCVNLYLTQDNMGKKKYAFLNTPGLEFNQILADSNDQFRMLYNYGVLMYAGAGATIYTLDASLVPTTVGTIGTDVGYISVTANNGNQVIFVDGQAGYIYDILAATFTQITAPGFPPNPINVAFLDGYFVIPSAETRTFQISALNDGTKWDAFDNALIQAYPGVNVGVGVVNRRLYFFKTDSTEVWYNQGAADFPFRRDNNLIFNFGCLTAASIVSDFGYLFWVAQDKDGTASIMMTQGQVPIPISNDSIDLLIQSFASPALLSAYCYKDGDHVFYVVNWTIDDYTFVYNVKMGEAKIWHRMEMQSSVQNDDIPFSGKTRHLADCHAYFNGQHYVGSYKNPSLYLFSRNISGNEVTDGNVQPIRRSRTCKNFFDADYKRIQVNKIELDMETGLGNDLYPNPDAYLKISRDGGHLFGNEVPARIGAQGERLTRVYWPKKGISRNFVADFSIYADVAPIAILGASIDYQGLSQ